MVRIAAPCTFRYEGRSAGISRTCERLPVRQAKAAIQALADQSPHAALDAKVGKAQIVYFAKSNANTRNVEVSTLQQSFADFKASIHAGAAFQCSDLVYTSEEACTLRALLLAVF